MDPYQHNHHYYNYAQATNCITQSVVSQLKPQENTSDIFQSFPSNTMYDTHYSMISHSQIEPKTWNISQYCPNKSIYINQNFQGTQNLPLTSNKVLINPNFLGSSKVHINPSHVKIKGVFINPHVIASQTKLVQMQAIEHTRKVTPDVVISTKNKWIRKSPQIITRTPTITNVPSTSRNVKSPLKYTKYKIIRKDTTSKRKRRTSLNLRYKLVRSHSLKSKSPEKQTVKNKFKLDRRLSTEKLKSKLHFLNKAYRLNIDHRNGILKRNNLSSIKSDNKMSVTKERTKMSRILNISGVKYKMDNNKRVLKLATTTVDVNTPKRTVKMRRDSQFSKIPLRIKLRTNNIPCPTYHRFGICQRQIRGMCQKVHNPDQIALCSKFLQGVCHNDKCLLSHKISPSKMPTCKFYLEGLCTKDSCPYLHVKINPKVAICKPFLSGFCHLGKECDKRHEFLCPKFEHDGACAKRNCPFPHKLVKCNSTEKVKVVRNQVKYNKVSNSKKHGKPIKNGANTSDKGDNSNKRYYQDSLNTIHENNVEKPSSACNNLIEIMDECKSIVDKCDLINSNGAEGDFKESSSNDIVQVTCSLAKRPQLGTLPLFIPF